MAENKYLEIICPACKEKLHAETPKTLRQWKAPLIAHLIAGPAHHLKAEEAEDVVDSYLLRLRYFLRLHEQETEKTKQ